jgi:hypothetical protein
MNMMKLGIKVALVLACAGLCAAETAQERGKRVVLDALQAVGGKAYLAMEDRVESGRAYQFYREQLQGLAVAKVYTRYVTPVPGKVSVRERESFFKDESDWLLFNEEGGWEVTFHGARQLDPKRIENYRDSTLRNIFYILRQRLDEPQMDFYWRGADRVDNLPVELVDITDADGRSVTVYFSRLDKLPVRQVFRRRNPEYKDFDTEETFFGGYRDAGGGVKWPTNIRRNRNGEKIFEMLTESVQINRILKDDLFTLPAKLKILPPAK